MPMPPLPKITFGFLLRSFLFVLVLGGITAWAATALTVHFQGAALIATLAALGTAALASCCAALFSARFGWIGILAILTVTGGWYASLRPSEERKWAFDVAHGVTARVDGQTVHMDNVRNFDWSTKSTATEFWESRAFDLDALASVDLVTSVWDNPDIAHIIVTFGFTDGQRVAFSVETRKEAHESFSVVGGFFKQFELVLIAATEEDILQLRTNHRQEDVHLYPLALDDTQMRDLFLSYVGLANRLADEPAFYNTLTHNCTTTLYPLAQTVHPELGLDWRMVMSGQLPDFINELGGLQGNLTMAQHKARAAITEVALTTENPDYTQAIRQAYAPK